MSGSTVRERGYTGERLYLVALVFWGLSLLITLSSSLQHALPTAAHLKNPLMAGCAFLLFIKIVGFQRFTHKEALAALLILFTGTMCSLASRDAMPIVIAAFVASSEGVRLKSVVKVVFSYVVFAIVVSSISTLFFGGGGLYRYDIQGLKSLALGFNSKNTLGGYLLSIVACITYLLEGKRRKTATVLTAVILVLDYGFVNSRTSALIVLLILAYQLAIKKDAVPMRGLGFSKAWFIAVFLAVVVVSVGVCVCYTSQDPLLVATDDLFSNRLSLAHYFFDDYGLTLFGQEVDFRSLSGYFIETSFYAIDNAYCHFLITYGIIPFLLLVAANLMVLARGESVVSRTAVVLFLCFSLYGACECLSYYPQINPFFSIIGMVIFSDSGKQLCTVSSSGASEARSLAFRYGKGDPANSGSYIKSREE
ncbi:hypothetical protein [uncultured Senegalimassilia sp.]|uniref:hypothetical protein n=1 Tax=uncultured Senegalimassilia sp. TaxID=1714350 RepID=UPI0025D5EFA7|nr:hypothetical protein [uncultured Senegalimassilia sp.]